MLDLWQIEADFERFLKQFVRDELQSICELVRSSGLATTCCSGPCQTSSGLIPTQELRSRRSPTRPRVLREPVRRWGADHAIAASMDSHSFGVAEPCYQRGVGGSLEGPQGRFSASRHCPGNRAAVVSHHSHAQVNAPFTTLHHTLHHGSSPYAQVKPGASTGPEGGLLLSSALILCCTVFLQFPTSN